MFQLIGIEVCFVIVLLSAIAFLRSPRVAAIANSIQEPPVVRSVIPVIGHVIGLVRHKTSYYVHLRLVVVQSPFKRLFHLCCPG